MRMVLPSGDVVRIDAADAALVAQFRWTLHCRHRPSPYVRGYRIGDPARARVYLHVLLMRPAPGLRVDHLSGDSLDNRRRNLRVCPQALNARNVRGRSGRRWKGVYPVPGGWRARIFVAGRAIGGGTHRTARAAALAYDALAIEHHGPFARLNLPRFAQPVAGRDTGRPFSAATA